MIKQKEKNCKNCEELFMPRFKSTERYCWKEDCKAVEVKLFFEKKEQDKKKEWNKEKAEFKENDKSLAQVANDTQKVFNEFIRLRDKGLVCISCRKVAKKENAGHYFNANNHWNVRFNEDNVHLQCEPCNNNLSGNLIPYRKYLIEKIGVERFEYLESISEVTRNFTKDELRKLKKEYRLNIKTFNVPEIDLVDDNEDNPLNKLF